MHRIIIILVCFTSNFVRCDDPDPAYLNFTQLAQKYGHECEEFDVITEDQYILKLFHVKGDPTRPLLLVHGVLDTPDIFLLRGKSSLAITAAAKGYDVWAFSVRGNKYSRRHVLLNPDIDKEFWNYTLHEMGVKDLPAIIDYVLGKTMQAQLLYIGHSQGNQISFVMGSMMPEYHNKLKAIVALAPIAYLSHVPVPTPVSTELWPALNTVFKLTGQEEMLKNSSLLATGIHTVCRREDIGYELCGTLGLFPIMGPDPEECEPDFFQLLMAHYPSWTSRKNVDHLVQILVRKKFAQYDYKLLNLEKYGALEPPEYPLEKITKPVYLLAGRNDRLAVIEDVQTLNAELPNPHYHVIDHDLMNHIDFVVGKNMEVYLYPLLFDILNKEFGV